MEKIICYWLYFKPGSRGRIVFRLANEPNTNHKVDLDPQDFSAVAAVLAQKRISYDVANKTFVSYDDDNLPLNDEQLIV